MRRTYPQITSLSLQMNSRQHTLVMILQSVLHSSQLSDFLLLTLKRTATQSTNSVPTWSTALRRLLHREILLPLQNRKSSPMLQKWQTTGVTTKRSTKFLNHLEKETNEHTFHHRSLTVSQA